MRMDEAPGVSRLTIFAKGNVDVRDSLLCSRVGGEVQWNGVNEVIRRRFPGCLARVRHETWTRSDALLASSGEVPEALRDRHLSLGAYTLDAQFSRRVFDSGADVVVLSLQPDVTNRLVRDRAGQYLFLPAGWDDWTEDDHRWLREHCDDTGLLDVEASMESLGRVCRGILESGDVRLLVYNMSAVVPGDRVHCYRDLGEITSTRVRRFNLGLVGLSEALGFSVVDVDRVVACGGADRLKLDYAHLNAEGYRLVAEEVVNVLDDLGCFDTGG